MPQAVTATLVERAAEGKVKGASDQFNLFLHALLGELLELVQGHEPNEPESKDDRGNDVGEENGA